MKKYKPLYVKEYKLSDKWYEEVKKSYDRKIDGYDIISVCVPMFYNPVYRWEKYFSLIFVLIDKLLNFLKR